MTRIAFIGLGNMGGGMAARLVGAGHEVAAFDLSAEALERAEARGCTPAASAREEYLRAVVSLGDDGSSTVRAAENQDSSLLSPFLVANCLIRRPIKVPAAKAGDLVEARAVLAELG
jgi:molybdopterin biosynthesis enzyme